MRFSEHLNLNMNPKRAALEKLRNVLTAVRLVAVVRTVLHRVTELRRRQTSSSWIA